jgi:alkylation response protein AidB-like acyl-CoA dehydrogenase
VPLDTTPESYDEHDNIREDLLEAMRNKAKDEGLWAPQMPVSRGGQGLSGDRDGRVLRGAQLRASSAPWCATAPRPTTAT